MTTPLTNPSYATTQNHRDHPPPPRPLQCPKGLRTTLPHTAGMWSRRLQGGGGFPAWRPLTLPPLDRESPQPKPSAGLDQRDGDPLGAQAGHCASPTSLTVIGMCHRCTPGKASPSWGVLLHGTMAHRAGGRCTMRHLTHGRDESQIKEGCGPSPKRLNAEMAAKGLGQAGRFPFPCTCRAGIFP